MSIFSDRLTYFREKNRLSKSALASLVKKSPQAYGNYESGAREPSLDILCNLCVALKCTPNDLLGFSIVPTPNNFERIKYAFNIAGITIMPHPGKIHKIWGQFYDFYKNGQPHPCPGHGDDYYRMYLFVNRIINDCEQETKKTIANRINLLYDLDLFHKTNTIDKWLINDYLYEFNFLFENKQNIFFHNNISKIISGEINNPFGNLNNDLQQKFDAYKRLIIAPLKNCDH